MLDADTKRIINNARDILVGKVPNPQSQVDLITIAMIYKFMDDMDLQGLELAGKRTFFVGDLEQYAFSKLLDPKLGNQGRMNLYAEALDKLPLAASIPELFRTIFRGAFLPFRDPQTLTMFLKEISNFSYDNSEVLGNAFEYLLSIMGSQGDAGQFRTPRHIIDFIVAVVKPAKDETILDPACGTAGFLISAYLYIKNHNTLAVKDMQKLTDNIIGYDISPDMRKLALVNLYLHKFADPKIYEYDTLTSEERWNDKFDVILANPPFMTPKGGIIPHNRFGVQANKSEVLFVDYIAEHLNLHGRAGIIVPEGIIFQSATAYKKLRKMLIDDNFLYAVVSLPSGVFLPYAGVKTSILFFDRQVAKKSKDILFVKIDNDGYELGAQRKPITQNDLPEAVRIIDEFAKTGTIPDNTFSSLVSKDKIHENGEYNLVAGRYAENLALADVKYPLVSLADLEKDGKIEFLRGQGLSKKDLDDNGRYPCILYGDLYTAYTTPVIDAIANKTNEKTRITSIAGDVLIPGTTTADAMGIAIARAINQDGVELGGDINIIRTKNETIDSIYLAYLFNTILKTTLATFAKGANIMHLSNNDIKTITIPIPPLSVQKQIVAEIENKQAAINHAIEIRRNLERERFYFANLLAGIDYAEVELGDDIYFSIESGGTPSTANPEFWNGGINWISLADLPASDGITKITKTERTITEAGLKNSAAKILPVDSIVVSSRATIGRVGITKIPLATNQGFKNIILKDFAKTNPVYIANAVAQQTEQMENLASGGTFKEISKTNFSTLKIPLPSLADQERIVAQVEQEESIIHTADNLIEIMRKKIDNVLRRIYKD